jgi:hypothetical protein
MSASPSQRQGRRCLFCGSAGPLTREHLWPDWMNREFPELTGPTTHLTSIDDPSAHQWVREIFGERARLVCGPCNSGWMSQLEHKVRPLLAPMFRGLTIKLGPQRQEILAAWALKTAFVRAATSRDEGPRRIPDVDRRTLFETRRPPAQTTIWTAARTPESLPNGDLLVLAARIQPIEARPDADDEARALLESGVLYGVSLGAGFAAFQIWGSTIEGQFIDEPARAHGALRRIWPTTRRFDSPPRAATAMFKASRTSSVRM